MGPGPQSLEESEKTISNSQTPSGYTTTIETPIRNFRMTSTSKLGDEFLRIPKLDVSGSNWVLYKERFFWALDARSI
jgi:hypothetical protein